MFGMRPIPDAWSLIEVGIYLDALAAGALKWARALIGGRKMEIVTRPYSSIWNQSALFSPAPP
jgi:hypothetical protein